jgi:hypothetical protein
VVRPERRTITRVVEQPSFVVAYERSSVYPKFTAYIEKWNVDIGDKVKKGDVMATLFVPELVEQRFPFSQVSDANVLVFPSLEAANIAYKLLQRVGGAEVVGPVLLGMGKSVHVLQAGDDVQNIVRMAAMAVLDAQVRDGQPASPEVRSLITS